MTNSAHAQLYNSEHKREQNSDIKRNKLVEFLRIVCWMSGKHYLALVNTFRAILYAQVTHSRTGRWISHGCAFVAICIGP